ncbi:UPF0462 protein C4orf33 homolog isoform X4 [Ovis canadensis]|uniref:UPF0462 protein C4orf33 homolog isoform X4 n=1 Tax=Ovis canadensis TaxID=37174 RepID=UPI003751DDAF
MDFKIEHTWDGFPVKHEPVFVRLNPGDRGVMMEVSAPFFNDPPSPLGEPGKPFNQLWDYEVVEAFFLNDITEQYLEVELCPTEIFKNNQEGKQLLLEEERGFPSGSGVKILLQCKRRRFDPWVRKISWRRKWSPTPAFLPGKSYGQRSLAVYSPWSCRGSEDSIPHEETEDGQGLTSIALSILKLST